MRLYRLGQTRGLDPLAIETGLQLQLAGEGLALVGVGPEAVDLEAVLVSLVAMRIDRGLSRARLPTLSLCHIWHHGEGGKDKERAEGGHETEDGTCRADVQAWPSAGRRQSPDPRAFDGIVLKLARGRDGVFGQ